MWFIRNIVLFTSLIICTVTVSYITKNSAKFSIDYFKYRQVNFVCLLTCHGYDSSTQLISKMAANNSLYISSVYLDDNINISTRLTKCLQTESYHIGVVLDARCEGNENVLYFASQNMFLDNNHKWLIINNDVDFVDFFNGTSNDTVLYYQENNKTVINVLGELNISVDADVILATNVNDSSYHLQEAYNYGKIQGGNLIINYVGSWAYEEGFSLNFNLNGYKYYRRWNFQNWQMKMILVVSPAPKYFDPELLNGLSPVTGVATITHTSAAILNVVAEIHNFRFNHTITDRWIGPFDRNSKKVVCNTLYFREQDISPMLRVQASFTQYMDFVAQPITAIETRYYYRIPTTGPGKFENQFLRPFGIQAWWSVIAVSVLCAIILLLTAWLEQRPSSVQYAVFSVMASICQQFFQDIDDSGTSRISSARKVTILITGLSCVLLYNYYTSSVVSWLLNGPPPSINSLRELLESPLELIFEDIGYTRSWLQQPTYYFNKRNAKVEDELRSKKVFNKKKNAPLLVPLVQGIKMVQDGGYAYHTEVNSANVLISKMFTQSDLCELGSLQSMEKTVLYTVLQKNSPYKEFISWSTFRLRERGIVSCIQSRTVSKEVSCEGSSPRALALGGAAPTFILLFGGYLMATVIMLVERWLHKIKTNKLRINVKI